MAGLLTINFIPLREFGEGKYRAVDDKTYGGGAGMVMMPGVLERALERVVGGAVAVNRLEQDVWQWRITEAARQSPEPSGGNGHLPTPDVRSSSVAAADGPYEALPHVLYLSPQGKRLDAAAARRLAKYPHLALVCGHYEGIDERAIDAFVHEEVSIGDFILTGGEPAALVLIDAISRFIPGIVGEQASVEGDTFEGLPGEMLPGGLKYPVYTRPADWRGRAVPPVLISGHHGEVAKWRRARSEERTRERRADLWDKLVPARDPSDRKTRKK